MPIEIQIEKTARQAHPGRRDAAPRAAPTRPSRSSGRRRTSSAWACSATGTTRTRRWPSRTRPTRSARSASCWRRAYVYRGLKPVNWCFDCGIGAGRGRGRVRGPHRTSRSTSRFAFADASGHGSRRRSASPTLPAGAGMAVIWTTTPWTIPANQALNAHPDFEYALVATERGPPDAAPPSCVDACLAALRARRRRRSRPCTGAALEQHPLPPPVLRPRGAGLPRRVRDARHRHRHRPHRAGVRHRGLRVLPRATA